MLVFVRPLRFIFNAEKKILHNPACIVSAWLGFWAVRTEGYLFRIGGADERLKIIKNTSSSDCLF